ncbi:MULTISPECIES: hypothetical protein [Kitasatospora]|uniref:Uncharacterized protein n=1 Tax=Kitasatospora setae (strain ATCC 33774 / DSM 43861 / JCM 3304 / KCC A-0304 / NBRC 14216 / KM-6054) TaxID=452652 RepID=E4NHE5_KITSK|nr:MULTISPECIES: hypothetical protein [Kitasatospora]BAJ30925.1 hypothetical protein KSE_51460 [Kitasatospora setae KM-6054]
MKDTPPGYTVGIAEITEPTSFLTLAPALSSLWQTLRTLPLGWTQFEAYRYFFGPGATGRTEEFLARDGRLRLSFALLGRTRLISVLPTVDGPIQLVPAPLRLVDSPEVTLLRLNGTGGRPDLDGPPHRRSA